MTYDSHMLQQLGELLEAADARRAEAVMAPIFADQARDRELELQASWRVLIAKEAIRFYYRIAFLKKHPKLPRFLGGSAFKIEADGGMLKAPLLQALTAEQETTGQVIITSSLQLSVGRPFGSGSDHNKVLKIDNIIQETTTNTTLVQPKYSVYFRLGSPDNPALVHSPDIMRAVVANYCKESRGEKVADEIDEHGFTNYDRACVEVLGTIIAVNRALHPKTN